MFVLVNISSWSSTPDKFQLDGGLGGLCPKLTNLSPCPQPLPRHRRTMPRQKIPKSRINFRLFPKVAFHRPYWRCHRTNILRADCTGELGSQIFVHISYTYTRRRGNKIKKHLDRNHSLPLNLMYN